jgi:hypothetical protein
MASLLGSLRAGLVEPRLEAVDVQGRDLLLIQGKWVSDGKSARQVPAELQFRAAALECRVYLDAGTLWPCCVEWWGGVPGRAPQLLVQSAYDLRAFNQPLSEERIAREFPAELK